MPRKPTHAQLEDLAGALVNYQERMDYLASITECDSAWPSDPPHPGYAGTRCQLLAGHPGQHRHRMLGSRVTVNW